MAQKKRILIVDDSPIVLTHLKNEFEDKLEEWVQEYAERVSKGVGIL